MWMHAGHAALTDVGNQNRKTADTDILEIHHYMDTKKQRPDYVGLLETAVRENRCPRTLYYLGREYLFAQRYDECYDTLIEYLDCMGANWKAERANAMRMIGRTLEEKKDIPGAISWFLRANAEWPNIRDIWWELLRCLANQGDAMGAAWAGEKCLSLTERDGEWLSGTAEAWKIEPFLFTAWAFRTIGRHDEARKCINDALAREDGNPEDIRQFAIDNKIVI